jgi:hypothetical protein
MLLGPLQIISNRVGLREVYLRKQLCYGSLTRQRGHEASVERLLTVPQTKRQRGGDFTPDSKPYVCPINPAWISASALKFDSPTDEIHYVMNVSNSKRWCRNQMSHRVQYWLSQFLWDLPSLKGCFIGSEEKATNTTDREHNQRILRRWAETWQM